MRHESAAIEPIDIRIHVQIRYRRNQANAPGAVQPLRCQGTHVLSIHRAAVYAGPVGVGPVDPTREHVQDQAVGPHQSVGTGEQVLHRARLIQIRTLDLRGITVGPVQFPGERVHGNVARPRQSAHDDVPVGSVPAGAVDDGVPEFGPVNPLPSDIQSQIVGVGHIGQYRFDLSLLQVQSLDDARRPIRPVQTAHGHMQGKVRREGQA